MWQLQLPSSIFSGKGSILISTPSYISPQLSFLKARHAQFFQPSLILFLGGIVSGPQHFIDGGKEQEKTTDGPKHSGTDEAESRFDVLGLARCLFRPFPQ